MLTLPDLTDEQRDYLDEIKKELEDELSKNLLTLENPYPKEMCIIGYVEGDN